MIIEALNSAGRLWAGYVGPALVQNTLFICLIFFALALMKNVDARLKYTLTLIGLIKLTMPLVFPLHLSALFPSLANRSGTLAIGDIEVLSAAADHAVKLSLPGLLFVLWGLTAAIYLLTALSSTVLLSVRLKRAELFAQVQRGGRMVGLYLSDRIGTPMTVGPFPKQVFLPPYWQSLSMDCRQGLIEHELAHIRRMDGIVQGVQIVVQALYFFHPLVWLLNEHMNEYREMICDDHAVKSSELTPYKYSRYLVRLAERVVPCSWSYTSASALIRRRNKLLKRVNYQMMEDKMIPTKLTVGVTLLSLILLMAPLSFYLGSDPPVEAAETGISTEKGPTVGKIAGRVVDEKTGEPLPGANVYLPETKLGAAADMNGRFYIINVPPGVYTLVASMMGYKTVKMADVRVTVAQTTPLDLALEQAVILLPEVTEVANPAESPSALPQSRLLQETEGEKAKIQEESPQPVPQPAPEARSVKMPASEVPSNIDVATPRPVVVPETSGEVSVVNKRPIAVSKVRSDGKIVTEKPPAPPAIAMTPKPAGAEKPPSPPAPEEHFIFVPYDEPPIPEGGFGEIQKHLVYPETARKAGVEGRVMVMALIRSDGTLGDVWIDKGLDESCNRAAIDAIKAVKWIPAKQRDKAIDVEIGIPVVFKLK